MADAITLPLQQFIASIDNSCLPKILQVCSGVYFQGSIYEIAGIEVCFSTGDLIKVIGIELQSVSCEDISNHETFELPISHTGLFKIVPEEMPYSSVEEMVSLRPLSLNSSLPFTFTCHCKMTLDNFTLGAGRALTVCSIEQEGDEEAKLRCKFQGQHEASAEVFIPFSTHGEFVECESKDCFTLQEIMSSNSLRSRRFRFINSTKCETSLVLTPVYEVHAIMNLRKNILKFPSSLEVDVVDVTEQCKDVSFVTPLSLTEVFSQPDETFPAVVEILEFQKSRSLLKCSWLPELNQSSHLIFHKVETSTLALLSSSKSRKAQHYFLVSQQYGGRFRRRPREFNSVYELYVASLQAPGLKFSVTRSSDGVEQEDLPVLSVGEQLEVICCRQMELPSGGNEGQQESAEALLCQRLQEPDDADDDNEEEANQEGGRDEVFLPLYMQGHFVEVLTDNKKYRLSDLGKGFSLPLDIKVVSRDAALQSDPLVGLACLRIEGTMLEPTILASFPHKPERCFEIPVQWTSMSVSLTSDPLPWSSAQPPERCLESVSEVTDTFFYEFCKRENSGEPPPPRPPKSSKSCKKKPSKQSKKSFKHRAEKSSPTKELANLTLNSKKRPPAPPPPVNLNDQAPPVVPRKQSATEMTTCKALPNTYVRMEESNKGLPSDFAADVNSDHDYETVDDTLMTVLQKAQENVKFF